MALMQMQTFKLTQPKIKLIELSEKPWEKP